VLLPIRALGSVLDVGSVQGAASYAVSFREPAPSHVLVVAERLSAPFAASAALAGGRILYGRPDSQSFAEAPEDLPPPGNEGLTLRLRGYQDPVSVSGAPEPLERFLDVRWSPEVRALSRPSVPGAPILLRQVGRSQPVMALALPIGERTRVEELLQAYPESRWKEVRFAAGEAELLLVSAAPGLLEGVDGAPFHRIGLADGRALFLPLGFSPEPEFALAWLPRLLGPDGDFFFWREGVVQSLRTSDLEPLTRRAWHEAFRDAP
jgi:hypothetical protein